MKIELNKKEIALICFILSACKVIMGVSNGKDIEKLIKKLNSDMIDESKNPFGIRTETFIP